MSIFLSPFKFIFELIGFLLSAAFVYGLALIVAFAIIAYGISSLPDEPPEIIVETVIETKEIIKFVEKEPEPTLTCDRIAGCEVFPNAITEEEYCPTCVVK